ncbi:MAG: S8 family serine peptidase [Fimbriimonadales bacterium]|nr:S8 family serine peptidase [Fimbriimonadales bacterium]
MTILLMSLALMSLFSTSEQPILTRHSRVLAAPDRVMVRFASETARKECEQAGFAILRDIPQIGYAVVRVPWGQVDESIEQLIRNGWASEAYPDRAYRLAYEPNDPLFPSQWNLFRMQVPQAWDWTRGSPQVVVAVLDTGVDYYHPELAPNLWVNTGEIPNNGIDDDGNGLVDDYLGYDFAYNDPNPMDDHGHGTACAGIVAAAGDNNLQIAGVAFQCRIMCVKIGLSNGYSYDSMFAPGVIYAAQMGAKVQSISYFSDDLTPALRAATDYAWKLGSLLVVAAGNYNEPLPLYPAGYDRAVGVAASTQLDRKASFSNMGSWVDVAAPGVGIYATRWGGGYTDSFAGTSAAAPNAAGVAALLWSWSPNARIETIREALEYSAEVIPDPAAGAYVNYGRVNADRALRYLREAMLLPDGFALWNPIQPAIHWISPHRPSYEGGRVTIGGRYFGWNPLWGRVMLNNQRLQVLEWTDGKIVVWLPRGARPGWLQVVVRGVPSNRLWLERAAHPSRRGAAPTDRQIKGYLVGGSVSGGFNELRAADGQALIADARDDSGDLTLYLLVRGLDKNRIRGTLHLTYRRQGQNLRPGVTEWVQLYNFASGSYPYGSFTTLLSVPPPTDGYQTVTIALPGDPAQYVSYEGDLFVRVLIPGAGANGQLWIDQMLFEWEE